ncbi:MAG: hypothetical protein A2383_03460 [Candidatus Pacebacteria bacterium RIFOXYB1_FULL_39_46]|nr:MAG: hypothetical protein A2182_03715 [Candidatus Pacebacteria bacterium RIFOXYA1_FULL_38_18]OGJ38475.1 MAG: hypothetical protein A2383_03460 [Candidatus Pacebacteria bacterium RIFOXYB1_FULL_39_46]OGJ40335.1 MAG: hypothetical protein A2411_03600 [Candidatus Pacebacteria bacterium RIFOXYC1_FULL_39_21]OGJ40454.1 MAG: hypothetical protein A2582_02345 [Candidatus Pacebacteria bacterium RIFOXYD1_FULL_39_27]
MNVYEIGILVVLLAVLLLVLLITITVFSEQKLPTEQEAREQILAKFSNCQITDLTVRKETKLEYVGSSGGAWDIGSHYLEITRTFLEYPQENVSILIRND